MFSTFCDIAVSLEADFPVCINGFHKQVNIFNDICLCLALFIFFLYLAGKQLPIRGTGQSYNFPCKCGCILFGEELSIADAVNDKSQFGGRIGPFVNIVTPSVAVVYDRDICILSQPLYIGMDCSVGGLYVIVILQIIHNGLGAFRLIFRCFIV